MEKLIKFAAFRGCIFLAVEGIWKPHIDRKIKK